MKDAISEYEYELNILAGLGEAEARVKLYLILAFKSLKVNGLTDILPIRPIIKVLKAKKSFSLSLKLDILHETGVMMPEN